MITCSTEADRTRQWQEFLCNSQAQAQIQMSVELKMHPACLGDLSNTWMKMDEVLKR